MPLGLLGPVPESDEAYQGKQLALALLEDVSAILLPRFGSQCRSYTNWILVNRFVE